MQLYAAQTVQWQNWMVTWYKGIDEIACIINLPTFMKQFMISPELSISANWFY